MFFTRRDDNGLYDDGDVNKKAADMRKDAALSRKHKRMW